MSINSYVQTSKKLTEFVIPNPRRGEESFDSVKPKIPHFVRNDMSQFLSS